MTFTRLLLRRHRVTLGSWLVLLIATPAGTTAAYQNTYATAQQRRAAVELAQHNAATTLFDGRLPDPGTPAQMFAWEMGAILTVLTAVMAVLVTIAVTRVAEDDGTLEVLRGCGLGVHQPLRSALIVLTGVAVVLAAGSGVAVGLASGRVDGITWTGASAFGMAMGLTFLSVAAVTVVLSQVASSAGQARLLGLAALGVSFGLRAFADTRSVDALNWLSPLGLRATIQPFTAERWWAATPPIAATALLIAVAVWLARRREFGMGIIRNRDSSGARLSLRTPIGLAVRLSRSSLLTWTIGVAALGSLITAMGSGTVRQSSSGDLGGFLGSQLGGGDPAAAFLAYCDTTIAILVACYAVLSVLGSARSESVGLTDLILATGVRRWAPLAAQGLVTTGQCAVILAVTGGAGALVASATIGGDDVALRAFTYAVGQWPSTAAVAGLTVLLVGLSPGSAWFAWLPVLAGSFLALLGNLLSVPQRVQDLGVFRHVPDFAGSHPRTGSLMVLVVIAAASTVLGAYCTTRRDVVVG